MQPNITGASAAVAVAIKPGEGITAATLQFGAEDIRAHKDMITAPPPLSSRAEAEAPVDVTFKISLSDLSTLPGEDGKFGMRSDGREGPCDRVLVAAGSGGA